MRKKFNNVITVIVLMLVSTFVHSEIYKCESDGKLIYQQLACPVKVEEKECDENHDYSKNIDAIGTSFDDKYCYYRQLNREEALTRARHLKEYQQKRDEALALAKKKTITDKLFDAGGDTTAPVQ